MNVIVDAATGALDARVIWLALSVACAVLGYVVAARGLFILTDGVRHSLIDVAAALDDDDTIAPDDRQRIEYALDTAYSSAYAWRLALRTAFVAIGRIFSWVGHLFGNRKNDLEAVSPVPSRALLAFQGRWAVAVFGNSLGATLVFMVFAIVMAATAMSISAILKMVIGKGGDDHTPHGNLAHS